MWVQQARDLLDGKPPRERLAPTPEPHPAPRLDAINVEPPAVTGTPAGTVEEEAAFVAQTPAPAEAEPNV